MQSGPDSFVSSDSETSLRVFEGKHTWTIRNWREWINCSEDAKKSTIYSDVFSIPIHDHDLLMYLRAGRSMAAFASMCDGSNPDESFQVISNYSNRRNRD